MQSIFLELVRLSLTGSLFAAAVMLVRLVFRKAPKWLFCVLWGVVALRLVCPVSIESKVSLVPDRLATGQIITNVGNEYIGEVDIIYESNAGYGNAVEAGRQPVYSGDGYYVVTEKDSLEAPKTVGQTVYPVLSWIWVTGMVLMLTYTAVSYLLLRRRMEEATRLRDNIWQCEQVDSPFVLGFIKPRICLPYAIAEADMANVIAHEQAHIRRKDHWWKPIGFLLLSVHWFNPVLWLAYILLCRDIEAACDERVIRHMEKDEMRAYSTALLHCSVHRRRIAACPLAFGETGVKERIRHVMNYKKPAFWIVAAAVLVSVIVACCFLTEPANPESATEYTITSYLTPAEQTQVTEAYNQSNKGITITVKFGTSEGPRQIELVYRYKKNATKEWMQRDPVIMSLGETATLTIPADNHFIIMAKSLGDYSGNVTFAIEEAPYAYKSSALESLKRSVPEYFDLDHSNGLDVYVWQMAKDHYSFGLLPHSETQREWISAELMNLKGLSVEDMRLILDTYGIAQEDIYVIPWQNPISSYIGGYWIVSEGEDPEQKRSAYVQDLRDMLFAQE